jgi:hypothetical protein
MSAVGAQVMMIMLPGGKGSHNFSNLLGKGHVLGPKECKGKGHKKSGRPGDNALRPSIDDQHMTEKIILFIPHPH